MSDAVSQVSSTGSTLFKTNYGHRHGPCRQCSVPGAAGKRWTPRMRWYRVASVCRTGLTLHGLSYHWGDRGEWIGQSVEDQLVQVFKLLISLDNVLTLSCLVQVQYCSNGEHGAAGDGWDLIMFCSQVLLLSTTAGREPRFLSILNRTSRKDIFLDKIWSRTQECLV